MKPFPLFLFSIALLSFTASLAHAENLDEFTWPREFETTTFETAIYLCRIHERANSVGHVYLNQPRR